jgi:hypothetical protein
MKSAKPMALMFSLLLILAAQMDLSAQTPAPAYVELDAVQLDQLVAPIALDPDSLVAQILTASTYPDQVAEADTWLNQNMNLPPDQRAAGANDKSWDPAVKGLIEFPAVLDTLAKNTAWTSQLGNAYYNQPGDIMNAIQAMRLQAKELNVLVTTVQQRVVVEAGLIEIVPVNPAVIYVPYYNPWRIWGTLFVSYPGFVVLPPPSGVVWAAGLGFDPGIALGVYAGFDWGFGAWAPAWGDGAVVFNHSTYVSHSTTVFNHGHFGGHDRGVFEHAGRGVPRDFHACAHAGAARAAGARASAARKPSAGHRTPSGHSAYGSRSVSAGRSGYGSHSTSASRSTSVGHSRSASRSASNGHSPSTSRTASAGHKPSSSHGSLAHQSAASHSASAGRKPSANRSATANRSASANHSAPANRSASANRSGSANRSASANRSTSANRSASAGRSAASHPASAGRMASASHMPSGGGSASAGRSGGGHSGGKGR